MSIFTIDTASYFKNQPYIQGLQLGVQDYGQQQVVNEQQAIATHQAENAATTNPTTTTNSNIVWYVGIGIVAVGLLVFAIIKKKGAKK
jgi:uncharacterized membrane protein YgcG